MNCLQTGELINQPRLLVQALEPGAQQVNVNDNLGSPAAGDTTLGVERLRPLFHLLNGDLCYANYAADRVRTGWDF